MPRFRKTIDFKSQERLDLIENYRSTEEWKALTFSQKFLLIFDKLFKPGEDSNNRAKEFIKDLALGRPQNILDVQKLADELGVPSQRLAEIIVKQNGGKQGVKH